MLVAHHSRIVKRTDPLGLVTQARAMVEAAVSVKVAKLQTRDQASMSRSM